jgi:protein CWC15
MSTAHRPTWNPAQGKEVIDSILLLGCMLILSKVKSGSRQFSARDVASQTKLKFRQPGQTSEADVQKRDLRAELLKAEQGARERKRKAAGGTFVGLDASVAEIEDRNSEEIKRRKLLQDALELDKDDDDEVEVKEENRTAKAERYVLVLDGVHD